MNSFTVKTIGYARTEHLRAENTPIQPVFAQGCTGRIELLPQYENGLQDIDGFSHIILLYWLHKANPEKLLVKPFLEDVTHGIFATRFPQRPNSIGISIVSLISREKHVLHIQGVDILDETPIIDIKPYSSKFDCFPDARNGWMDNIVPETAEKRGRRGYKQINETGIV